MKTVAALLVLLVSIPTGPAGAQTIQGRWKLIAAEDVRADGSVARYPWGPQPVGSIVVEGGACYVQIMSSDLPSFSAPGTPANARGHRNADSAPHARTRGTMTAR
jgi:hypothetical protein